jgi:hypothetical protein
VITGWIAAASRFPAAAGASDTRVSEGLGDGADADGDGEPLVVDWLADGEVAGLEACAMGDW